MFNADLTIRNDNGLPVAYLSEAVPQLNSDTWKVNPDGTMDTTYHLKANTVWHDGQALTADDFVFSAEVYKKPELGLADGVPMSLIAGVTAPDARTVVIHWKQTYPDADGGGGGSSQQDASILPPLPRHILGPQFETQAPDAFVANLFWTQEYIGAGPYKLDRWETGAFLEGSAFSGDVFGKPKITRIRENFISDPNTVIANLLSGDAQLTAGDSIRFTDGETLREQWGERGSILNFPNLYRHTLFQWRPEYASTRAFTDLRVRQALHYGFDFPSVNETIQAGRTTQAIGPIPPTMAYYKQLDAAVTHYPYDPQKSQQLMTEAGFTRASDGVWVSPNPAFGRMSFETNVLTSPDSDNEMHLMADAWRKLGFDIKEVSWAPAIGADNQTRNTFPGLSTTSDPPGEKAVDDYRTNRIPSPDRRWQGRNRGGWMGTPDNDRLIDVFDTSLDRDQRTQAIIGVIKTIDDSAAEINLYWKLNAVGFAKGVTGPRLTDLNGAPEWNIQDWDLK
jgi:peptide/nickel transport system substrate-binding protein